MSSSLPSQENCNDQILNTQKAMNQTHQSSNEGAVPLEDSAQPPVAPPAQHFRELKSYKSALLGLGISGKAAQQCDCSPGKCDMESECVNFLADVECSPRSSCSADCGNQRIRNGSGVELTTIPTLKKGGEGVMTKGRLQKGDLVCELTGEIIQEEEAKKRQLYDENNGLKNSYMFRLQSEEVLDMAFRGSKGRLMNHSCNPNCELRHCTVDGTARLGVFARREIAPETELTFDYANDGIGDTTIVCKCRSKDCDDKVYRDEDEGGEEGDPTFGKDYEKRGFASLDYIAARLEDRGFVLAILKKPKELWKGREGESQSARERRLALLDRMKLHWRDDEEISKLFRFSLAL